MMHSLDQKVDPAHCVVVVDVQNDFCSPGGFADKEGKSLNMMQKTLLNLRLLLSGAEDSNVPRIFLQANYSTAFNWYLSPSWLDRASRVHPEGGHIDYGVCEEGTWGFDFVEGVAPRGRDDEVVVRKHRYSGFVGTELDLILRSRGIKTVVVAGVATNVCVESTARDAFLRDYFVVLPSDCCAAFSEAEHESTLLNVRKYFGEVTTAGDLVDRWRRRAA